MGVAGFNIVGNFAIVLFETTSDNFFKFKEWIETRRQIKMIEQRKSNRLTIVEDQKPETFPYLEYELSVYEALKIIKKWLPERRWLKANGVNFENFPEEKRFK